MEAGHLVRPDKEVAIRSLAVGLLALATVAAAGVLLRRRTAVTARGDRAPRLIDALYAAGL